MNIKINVGYIVEITKIKPNLYLFVYSTQLNRLRGSSCPVAVLAVFLRTV